MPKVFTSKTQKIGELGEKIALIHLKNKGFSIIESNFTCGYGEIDIIALGPKERGKDQKYLFIEVKTISQETIDTYGWRPEQNFHQQKLMKMVKTIHLYKSQHRHIENEEILLATVVLNPITKKAHVSLETIV